MDEYEQGARWLYEYQNGAGPKGDAWEKVDYPTRARYLRWSKVVQTGTGHIG